MSEEIDLPALHEGIVDAATIGAYLTDLQGLAEVHAVQVKGGSEHRTDGAAITLTAALMGLIDGSVHGVQVHYTYDGQRWLDTLLQTPKGVKLVRMAPKSP